MFSTLNPRNSSRKVLMQNHSGLLQQFLFETHEMEIIEIDRLTQSRVKINVLIEALKNQETANELKTTLKRNKQLLK